AREEVQHGGIVVSDRKDALHERHLLRIIERNAERLQERIVRALIIRHDRLRALPLVLIEVALHTRQATVGMEMHSILRNELSQTRSVKSKTSWRDRIFLTCHWIEDR